MPTTVETDQLIWMRDQLARFTYRPGWTMTIEPGAYGAAFLLVRYETVDSRNPDQLTKIRSQRPLDPCLHLRHDPEDAFVRDLQRALDEVERHESREWLRRDGQLVDDPHRDPSRHHCARCGGVGPFRHECDTWTCPRGELMP